MRRLLPDPVVGGFVGFILGFLATFSLLALGIDASGWPSIGLGLIGACVGCLVGSCLRSAGRAGAVARWTVVVGLVGFAGPIILHPELSQGPLLGIFYTGPLGAIAGAVLGALIGLLIPLSAGRPSNPVSG